MNHEGAKTRRGDGKELIMVAMAAQSGLQERLDDLISYIKSGRILEAMHEFYHPNCQMQENLSATTTGLEANVARQQAFLAQVAQWRSFDVLAAAASGDVTFMETRVQYRSTDGREVDMSEVSVARWKDRKIIHERFYYDPTPKTNEVNPV